MMVGATCCREQMLHTVLNLLGSFCQQHGSDTGVVWDETISLMRVFCPGCGTQAL